MDKKAPEPLPADEKLLQNLLKALRLCFLGRYYKPMSRRDLRLKLGLPTQHDKVLRKAIALLVEEGLVLYRDQSYHRIDPSHKLITGILIGHPRGFGFLQPEAGSGLDEEVFIPRQAMGSAFGGDRVQVRLSAHRKEGKGIEGEVVAVLERSAKQLAGTIYRIDEAGAWLYVPVLGASRKVVIDEPERQLEVGDRAVGQIEEWGEVTRCRLLYVLGSIEDASIDVAAAKEEFSLPGDFSEAIEAEAKAKGSRVRLSEMAETEDLRTWETFTIDPATARDFDDALSLRKNKKGHYELAVHIADVSHYVPTGSLLDVEARRRCNSTYLTGCCLPMLPSALSDHLCSLRAGVNRLVITIFMTFNKSGELVHYRFGRSTIRSQKRFSYEEAKEVLDGKKPSKHRPTLELMVELCKLLKEQRHKRGSIEFSLSETVIDLDAQGEPIGTRRVEYDVTHQLVEEFMLKANEIVATHLAQKAIPLAFRVHEEPPEENLRDFVRVAQAMGFPIDGSPSPEQLQAFFEQVANEWCGEYLANVYIRRMRLACYAAENIGHYGLSLEHYCHFTSPIRRYSDLIVHRILLGESYSTPELERVAQECSDRERVSARAEQSFLQLKKLRLLRRFYGQDPHRQYRALVTHIKPHGLYFEVVELMMEGFIHISELGEDYYLFDEEKVCLKGRHTGHWYQLADELLVMVSQVDLLRRESSWHLVDHTERGGLARSKGMELPRSKKKGSQSTKARHDKKYHKRGSSHHKKGGKGSYKGRGGRA